VKLQGFSSLLLAFNDLTKFFWRVKNFQQLVTRFQKKLQVHGAMQDPTYQGSGNPYAPCI